MSRIRRIALAVIALICRHGRSRHVGHRRGLLAAIHVLRRHGRRRHLRVRLAQCRRRRSIPWTLEPGGIYVRRPNLWHGWMWSIVSPWFMSLTLQTGGRLVARQLAGRNGVGQRVRAAVPAVVRGRNRTKTHWTSRVAHARGLRVRDEGRHGLHARHRAATAIGTSLPITRARAYP